MHEEIGRNILCFCIDAIQIIAVFPIHFDVFLIKVLPPFQFWLYFFVEWILKKPHIFYTTA